MEFLDITSTTNMTSTNECTSILTSPNLTGAEQKDDIYLEVHESGHSIMNEHSSNENNRMINTKAARMVRLRQTLLQFFSVTTFQGLPHIANASNKKSYCRLMYWSILILIAIGLMTWAMVSVTLEYVEKNTSLQSRQTLNSRIAFPAVTICNQNLFRKSIIANVTNITDDLISFLTLVSGNNAVLDDFDVTNFLNLYSDLFVEDSVFYYNNSGHQLRNMLLSCRYAGRLQNCNFTQQSSTSGNCYTFNSGEDDSTFYSTEAGYLFGLELILNAEEYEYFLPDIDSVGFNVFIHHKHHFPFYGGVGGFSVSTGQLTQVVIHKVNYKLLTPSFGGQCSNGVKLKYFKSFSLSSCMSECVTDFMVSYCGCKLQFMPGRVENCQLSDTCWYKFLLNFNGLRCDCPIACDYTTYERTLSYAKFPAAHLTDTLNTSFFTSQNSAFPEFLISRTVDRDGTEVRRLNDNFTESFMRNNLVKLRIYYDDLVVTTREEVLDYTMFQFIADFGGHIGLFTGAGFLTLFEIIELCFALKANNDDDNAE